MTILIHRTLCYLISIAILFFLVGCVSTSSKNEEEIEKKRQKAIQSLKKLGIDVEQDTYSVNRHLQSAAEDGDTDTLIALIDKGADVNARLDKDGWTALTYAANYGHTDTVIALIDKGADVNAKDIYGHTALYRAGNADIVKILIEKGADVNARTNNYEIPLVRAVVWKKDNIDIAKALIENGADVNAKDKWGNTPLIYAAAVGANKAVELLIEKGADVNAKNKEGQTALVNAANAYRVNTGTVMSVKTLIEKGANVNTKDENSKTALSYAEEKGHKDIVELLKKAGAKK